MIFRRDLLELIDGLNLQVMEQGERICELEARIKKLEPKKIKVQIKKPVGRPRKDTQPRDKSGKFAKK